VGEGVGVPPEGRGGRGCVYTALREAEYRSTGGVTGGWGVVQQGCVGVGGTLGGWGEVWLNGIVGVVACVVWRVSWGCSGRGGRGCSEPYNSYTACVAGWLYYNQ